jgi:hypothetical protein
MEARKVRFFNTVYKNGQYEKEIIGEAVFHSWGLDFYELKGGAARDIRLTIVNGQPQMNRSITGESLSS